MAEITLGGNPVTTLGNIPAVGQEIPDFEPGPRFRSPASKKGH